ncbi:N2227-like protein, putative [Plasmodium berghei]|uniref:carnosine N-methyltransferase n=2 Tax=Plasmodium berghei TaxID=5821 RepID=A0A509AFG7_PLABA|nr:N2227-like protein, putative [Plasmodium berghei ANKA]CXI01232.1 N2227-like protein, putative [Plasmodium berghei]SCL91796.1 N2227-like protein, putative [Plasmodium berghei]SCM15534.1 N2227-like protein, putative [Plasmodium berghei]SCM17326.1 N2227-like protein, putative [Plasmodium berghei]SCN22545.1 N2227-like protein, putative [Plasmodium berghei]|eukprot:XP_034420132.1 N2227-like protein, putative [Plasmodium berghei ANKA]
MPNANEAHKKSKPNDAAYINNDSTDNGYINENKHDPTIYNNHINKQNSNSNMEINYNRQNDENGECSRDINNYNDVKENNCDECNDNNCCNSHKDCYDDDNNIDMLNDEEEKHFCNVCFSFLYYKKYCFYELLRIYRNLCMLNEEEKNLLSESIYCKVYKMYLAVLNNYYFILNILLPQISTPIILNLLSYTFHKDCEENNIDDDICCNHSNLNNTGNGAFNMGHINIEKQANDNNIRKKSREEIIINTIIDNLTEQEKANIDKIYNYNNLDARLLCKDDPLTILNEIKSKIMNKKKDCDMLKLFDNQSELLLSDDNSQNNNELTKKQDVQYNENSISINTEHIEHHEENETSKINKKETNLSENNTLLNDEKNNATTNSNDVNLKNQSENISISINKEECDNNEKSEHISPGLRITNMYSPSLDEYSLIQNMSKVRSTLRQFVRDWSIEGIDERKSAYEPILKSLEKYLPITDNYIPKILCPGSGLGRLPYEVAKRGYKSQGNEFSYFMLLSSNFILNYYNQKESLHIQPYCINTLNRKKRDDHLKIINLPDVNTYNKDVLNSEFSMCAGELVEVYYDEKEQFDGILTCFFLDTAKNIFIYIRTFANILKPNSLWSNIGPLLFHYAEMPNEMSIELAWDEIKFIISKWFTIVDEQWIDNYYTTNIDSMMQVQYHCIFFNAIRNDMPVEG